MNKLTLVTAASAVAFFAAMQSAIAAPQSTHKAPSSAGRVTVDLEGFLGRTSDIASILNVTNQFVATGPGATSTYTPMNPDELDGKFRLGWAIGFGYTFDDGSDLSISYRGIKEKNTKTNTYLSVTQLSAAVAGQYTTTTLTSSGDSLASTTIGTDAGERAYAFLSATDTLQETGELRYQQANLDWGHTFSLSQGLSFKPYVGIAWRGVNYKDSMTFASVGAWSGSAPTATSDFIGTGDAVGTLTVGDADPVAAADADAGIYEVTEITGGGTITGTGSADLGTTAGSDTFLITDNSSSDVSTEDGYIGDNLPSYTSKFSGFGPRFGFDSEYAFGQHFAIVSGVSFAMPYGQLKTSGNITRFITSDLQSGGEETSSTSAATLQTNVNLKVETYDSEGSQVSIPLQAFSAKEHKFIPELEMKLGLKFGNDLGGSDSTNYYAEVGYRVIEDWSALRNVNTEGSASATTSTDLSSIFGSSVPGFEYQDVTNFGPYLKAGVTFGT